MSAGAWTKLTWSTEAFDTNDNFANNRFTPTVAGKYLFTLTAYCEGSGDNDDCWVAIYKNGVVVSESGTGVHDIGGSSGPNVSIVLDMNGTTDYVEAYAWNRTGSSIHGETYTTNFSGALLSPQSGSGVWTSSGNDIYNTNTGKVGIGTASPAQKLDVAGTVNASGGYTQNSDARLKTNVRSIAPSTLDRLTSLNPITFNWINAVQGTSTQVGFVAQDVQKTFPLIVATSSATSALTPDGTLTLNYIGLIPYIVESIKELAAKVSETAHLVKTERVETQELCVQKSDGTHVCVTGDQLVALLTK